MHSSLPSPMGSDTQVVNLTQTLVSRLPALVFRSNNLTNVQRLYITHSTLHQVDKQVSYVPHLIILHLTKYYHDLDIILFKQPNTTISLLFRPSVVC